MKTTNLSLVASSIAAFAGLLDHTVAAHAEAVELVKAAVKESGDSKKVAKALTDLLVKEHNWKRQTASDFLIKHFGLRCRAQRSDTGPRSSSVDEDIRDQVAALARQLAGDKAADVLRAAYLSVKGKENAKKD